MGGALEEGAQTMRHVVLIEDEDNISEALRFILVRDGWEVTTHADGATALGVLRAHVPDVVILDMMLPGRSGFEVLAAMRADETLRAIPVLMLSARGQVRDREAAERAGANMFIAKPFANADILVAVQSLTNRSRE